MRKSRCRTPYYSIVALLWVVALFTTTTECFQTCGAGWKKNGNKNAYRNKGGFDQRGLYRPPPIVTASPSSSSSQKPSSSSSCLHALLDVPEGFFTITFAMSGLLLSVSKNFARIRMEENAWEQRLAESRRERLAQDPTLTELDLRRREAAMEWSAYGKPRMIEMEQQQQQQAYNDESSTRQGGTTSVGRYRRGRGGVRVLDRYNDDNDDDDGDDDDDRRYSMTDDEISAFELEYGIDYDPYYDDPYTQEELPMELKYSIDKAYGDRIYENGEIFYKDKSTGLYYRQGAKPRNLSFWSS